MGILSVSSGSDSLLEKVNAFHNPFAFALENVIGFSLVSISSIFNKRLTERILISSSLDLNIDF